MAFAPFNALLPVIAALVVFIFGYAALFVSLMICFFVCLVIAKGIYEGGKKVRSYTMRSAPAKTFISSDVALIPELDSGLIATGGRS
jgi:hypothetical protein